MTKNKICLFYLQGADPDEHKGGCAASGGECTRWDKPERCEPHRIAMVCIKEVYNIKLKKCGYAQTHR